MMRSLLLLTVAGVVLGAPRYEPIGLYYHESVGIPAAARIKATEEAADFDGARITGGSHALPGQYPHLGGLLITLANGATSVCGSSLLTNTRLLTAAHCWTDGQNSARQLTVVLGSVRLFNGGTRVTTTEVVPHAAYNHRTLHNDVAVIIVPWTQYTTHILPITLATGNEDFVGQIASAAGYGRTADGAPIPQSQVLSHVAMPVITNARCQATFGPTVVVESTLCTDTAGGRSVCHGDSGGSLQVGNVLMGVSSFVAAVGCERGLPAGFARVSAFAAWIQARL